MALRDRRARMLELQQELAALRSELGLADDPFEYAPQHEVLRLATERIGQLGTWSWDLTTNEIAWSAQLYQILGVDRGAVEPSAEAFYRAVHPDDLELVQQTTSRSLESNIAASVDFRVVRSNGEARQVRMEASFLNGPDGRRRYVVGTLIDETDKRLAAAQMASALAELREAQQIAALGSWHWILPEGRVLWSEGMFRLLDISTEQPVNEALFFKHVHPDDLESLQSASQKAVETGIPQQLEYRMVRTDGVVRTMIMRSRAKFDERHQLSGFHGVIQDVTERKALEDAARHAQKMEAVGTLAGGVAHDFNNYLMVIGGNLDLLCMTLPAEHEARRSLSSIQLAYERCANLTEQLLTLSRKRAPQPRRFDLVAAVEQLAPMLRSVLGPGIPLTLRLEPGTPAIFADPTHIEHALMNLVLNARDAIGAAPGNIEIAIEGLCVEPRSQGAFDAGFYVRLSISDSGCGIPSELQSRVFEPFFTTKAVGKGTGLGLAVVYGIVREAGGGIEVESSAGQGTTFHLYFCPAPSDATSGEVQTSRDSTTPRSERVLLVEDVALVRDLVRDQLAQAGFQVVTAADGVEALHRLRSQPIDVLLSDAVMPKMGGVELVRAAREQWPKLPCMLMSGYSTENLTTLQGELEIPILRKPFTAPQLRMALAELLDTVEL